SVLSLNAKAKNKPSVRIVVPGQEEDAVPKEMVKTKQEVIVIEKPSTPELKETTQELMIIPVEEDITEEAVESKVVIQEQPKVVVQESKPDQIMIIPVMDADEILEKEDAVLETKPRQGEPGWRRIHEVKKGETLYSISKLYKIELTKLKNWNNLMDNLISIGQPLIVSP
ncbi:MAG: LysM peptidoglycan-binding domain-containing protein, partial [Gammaproteobacteria bacterium]|nr:LysM peptidoglycan-binding domain-containing protein [Gammaproteobacteria bacterium]